MIKWMDQSNKEGNNYTTRKNNQETTTCKGEKYKKGE